MVECASLPKKPSYSVQMLETMVVSDGIRMAKNYGATNLIFESDAQLIINNINSPTTDFSFFGHFVESIRALFVGFNSCSFAFVNRSCSRATHLLARYCISANVAKHWLGCNPEDRKSVV